MDIEEKEDGYNLPGKENLPIKRTPLMMGQKGLNFGNVPEELVIAMTDDQKAGKFLSKYMEVVDPIVKFDKYFSNTAKDVNMTFKEIKTFYKKLVVHKKWTEIKYVTVINHVFEHRLFFGQHSLEMTGLMYDRGELGTKKRPERIVRRVR